MTIYLIGREKDCDVVVPDPSVSRRHVEAEDMGMGEIRLTDLGSSNGTYALENNRWVRIETTTVSARTPLRLGDVETTLERLIPELASGAGRDAGQETVHVPTGAANAPTDARWEPPAGGIGSQAASQPELSDARLAMMYDANKKSALIAYLLWFFLGGFGAHRFYLGSIGSAVAILLLWLLGWATVWFVVGWFVLVAVAIWLIVDAFLIPGMIARRNNDLIERLNAGQAA